MRFRSLAAVLFMLVAGASVAQAPYPGKSIRFVVRKLRSIRLPGRCSLIHQMFEPGGWNR